MGEPKEAGVEEEEEEADVFTRPIRKRKKKSGPKKGPALSSSRKRLRIVLAGASAAAAAAEPDSILDAQAAHPLKFEISQSSVDDVEEMEAQVMEFEAAPAELEQLEQQLEDSLAFFQETHEDQSPAYIAFHQQLAEKERQNRLQALDESDQQGRKEIEALIAHLCKERQAQTDRSLEKYRERAANEEKQNTQRLHQVYRQKTAANAKKINEGVQILERRHQKELHEALQHHQLQANQRRLNEAMAAQEWHNTSQQIQAKQQHQMQSFRGKGDDLKNRTENDFKREQEKIRKQYVTKMQELDGNRQKLFAKLYGQFQVARQRYLKRHLQRIMKEREELLRADRRAATTSSESNTTAAADDDDEGRGEQPHGGGSSSSSTSPIAAVNPREMAKSAMDRAELNPPAPIKSAEPWAQHLSNVSGAAARHKHRKGVMSQTTRQLSLELHNEGIWMYPLLESDDNKTNKKPETGVSQSDCEFIPWGIKAYNLLNTVVCGEIPSGYERILEKHPQSTELMQSQGSQVRCIVTDLRTSLETASLQRSKAIKEQDEVVVKDLEQKVAKLNQHSTEADKAVKVLTAQQNQRTSMVAAAEEEVKNAMRIQGEFKAKFHSFLGADGNPVPEASPNDRKELQKAMLRYRTNLDTATQRAETAKQSLAETKEKLQKVNVLVKTTQKSLSMASSLLKKKQAQVAEARTTSTSASSSGGRGKTAKQMEAAEAERSATRVKDVIGALYATAERRREKFEQKKSTSLSSAWVQSFPGLPSSLKKSLWHKMHRRKQQIILRPSEECLVNELRASVAHAVTPKYNGRSADEKVAGIEEEMLKAEQRYLLATHPFGDGEIATVPASKANEDWAEPGWQLNLSVPEEYDDTRILPCAKSFPVLERNLAEIASAPGRQAASLLRASHLRCLASPLSVFAVASSPAEENASLVDTRKYSDGDPLNVSAKEMELGYAFTIKPYSARQSAPRKRPSTAAAKAAAAAKTPTQAAPAAEASSKNETSGGSKGGESKSQSKKRRSSKTGAAVAAPPPPSPLSQRPTIPVPAPNVPTAPPPHYSQSKQLQQHSSQSKQHHSSQSKQQHHPQQFQPPPQQQQPQQQQQMRMQGSPPTSKPIQPGMQGAPQLGQPGHPRRYSGQQQHHYPPPPPQPRPADPYQHRMMQQQQQQVPSPRQHHPQQMNPAYAQIHQMQQFYAPLNHPMHMQARQPVPNNPQQHPLGAQGGGQQQSQQPGTQQRSQGSRDPKSNDSMYMMGKK